MNDLLLIDQLPLGLVELYADVNRAANKLDIPFLVVGAMARDLILVHGYGATITRGTRDVDFGIKVRSWDDFNRLSDELIMQGFTHHARIQHRFSRNSSDGLPWELDIVPFGFNADVSEISWPPSHDVVMNVLGFDDALSAAIHVTLGDTLTIRVCSPAGMGVLKLIAWLGRDNNIRRKDAADLLYLITTYHKIPLVFDALYDEGYMAANNWDDLLASAQKLGADMAVLASDNTRAYLMEQLMSSEARLSTLAGEMKISSHYSIAECRSYLDNLARGFTAEM